jgi:hypothetical protein
MKTTVKKASDKTPGAWVVSANDKGRKKNNQGKVYLKDKEEFFIELYNPTTKNIIAKIRINSNNITEGGILLSPGERFYLDHNINTGNKLIYEHKFLAKGVKKPIIINNDIVVDFYAENEEEYDNRIIEKHIYTSNMYNTYFDYNQNIWVTQSCTYDTNNEQILSDINNSDMSSNKIFGKITESDKKTNVEFIDNVINVGTLINSVYITIDPDVIELRERKVFNNYKKNAKIEDIIDGINDIKWLLECEMLTHNEYNTLLQQLKENLSEAVNKMNSINSGMIIYYLKILADLKNCDVYTHDFIMELKTIILSKHK